MGYKHRCTGAAAAPAPKDYGLLKPDKKVRPWNCDATGQQTTAIVQQDIRAEEKKTQKRNRETGQEKIQCSYQKMLLNLLLKTTGFSNLTKGEALLPLMLQANRQLQEFKDKGTLAKKLFEKGNRLTENCNSSTGHLGWGWGGNGGKGGGSKKLENWPGGEK